MKNIVVLIAVLLIVSCSNQKKGIQGTSKDNSSIENTQWILVEFDGKPVPESVVGKVNIQLIEDGKRISGSNGCNRLLGTYDITNGLEIKFSDVGSTMMACQNENWNETEFNKMLETTNNFTISGNKLMLNIGKRMPLAVFEKVENMDIVNKYWKLKKLEGREVKMTKNQEKEQYFILKNDGTISGFAGCNQFNGKFELSEGNRIRFNENLALTMKICPDVHINESEFMEVFKLTDNYTISGDILNLNVGRRAPLAEFEAVYF